MPSGDDPLSIMMVHRELLQSLPVDNRPSDSMQIRLFFEALSPPQRAIFAPHHYDTLRDVEQLLIATVNVVASSVNHHHHLQHLPPIQRPPH